MGLSPQNKEIYDSIRKKWVKATAEELVRQQLIHFMTQSCGYPQEAIAVEKSLTKLCNVPKALNRRLDLLCFELPTFRPLLLIECKSIPIQKEMISQVMGYNAYLQAPAICLANQKTILVFLKHQNTYHCKLPTYSELLKWVHSTNTFAS